MFGTNIRIKLKTWGFTHIPEICVHPPNVLPEYQERMKNVGLYTHPRNIVHPPNVWHEYQDRFIEIDILGFIHIPETTAVFLHS